MHQDLTQLLALQGLENQWTAVEARIAAMPGEREALEAAIAAKEQLVAAAKEALATSQGARRAIEKELAVVQGRLTKFKDQLMAVKTNKEYAAVQHEIATAEAQVKGFEDEVLQNMMEADELQAGVKAAEGELATERAQAKQALAKLESERGRLDGEHTRIAAERSALRAQVPASVTALFDQLIKQRRGIAVAEARAGSCTACHVRIRPQVYNDLRANDRVVQCDSCKRILIFVADAPPAPAPEATSPAQS